MELRRIASFDDLAPGAYGIPEPKADCPAVPLDEIDFAVIPCVSCDREGHRLGQGGGFYDRYLEQHPDHPTLAMCYGFQMFEHLDTDPHDIPVDYVLSQEVPD